jgi:hypothetical protein
VGGLQAQTLPEKGLAGQNRRPRAGWGAGGGAPGCHAGPAHLGLPRRAGRLARGPHAAVGQRGAERVVVRLREGVCAQQPFDWSGRLWCERGRGCLLKEWGMCVKFAACTATQRARKHCQQGRVGSCDSRLSRHATYVLLSVAARVITLASRMCRLAAATTDGTQTSIELCASGLAQQWAAGCNLWDPACMECAGASPLAEQTPPMHWPPPPAVPLLALPPLQQPFPCGKGLPLTNYRQ